MIFMFCTMSWMIRKKDTMILILPPRYTSDHKSKKQSEECRDRFNGMGVLCLMNVGFSINIYGPDVFIRIKQNPAYISTNSNHCKENYTGSHLENEVTVSSKITQPKPIRKSLRRNMVRNINVYNELAKKHKKEYILDI